MSFKSLDIKACYESGIGDIVQDFYEPVLSEAVLYDRISGFFTSASLAIAARGMSKFLKNGGVIRLITSPILSSADKKIIEKVIEHPESVEAIDLGLDLNSIEDALMSDHVKAFGWLLSQGKIDVKLAVLTDIDGNPITKENILSAGLFHQKVGILTDAEGNHLSFSGSINETANAWTQNDEEFKVFKEWEDSEQYYERDKERFANLWQGKKSGVLTMDLPSAVKNELIEYSKDFDIESISATNYVSRKRSRATSFELDGISLFFYQKEALSQWKEANYKMLFEMATGTGKTRTAIAGMNFLTHLYPRTITIISCPQNALAKQWKEKEIAQFTLSIDAEKVIDGTNSNWKQELQNLCLENAAGFAEHCIIYTTHQTSSSDEFCRIITSNVSQKTKLIFIGDEVHWLGAKQYRKALLPQYEFRIGLSATPSRWFDDNGTRILASYFGDSHFEFTIKDALTEINPITGKHFLVDYFYNVYKVSLTQDEGIEYALLTEKISKLYRLKDSDLNAEERYNRLLERRADIIKNATNKFEVLSTILDSLKSKDELKDLIIFVSPQQKETVKDMLREKKIIFHQLTEEEGNRQKKEYDGKTERQFIIRKFVEKQYQALVAIKCLDEGIDIPSACRGILMASSTNPREYVQRIGRIIRQDKNKAFAYLYDICVESSGFLSGELLDIDAKIRRNEQQRLKEIAMNAINATDAVNQIFELS